MFGNIFSSFNKKFLNCFFQRLWAICWSGQILREILFQKSKSSYALKIFFVLNSYDSSRIRDWNGSVQRFSFEASYKLFSFFSLLPVLNHWYRCVVILGLKFGTRRYILIAPVYAWWCWIVQESKRKAWWFVHFFLAYNNQRLSWKTQASCRL